MLRKFYYELFPLLFCVLFPSITSSRGTATGGRESVPGRRLFEGAIADFACAAVDSGGAVADSGSSVADFRSALAD